MKTALHTLSTLSAAAISSSPHVFLALFMPALFLAQLSQQFLFFLFPIQPGSSTHLLSWQPLIPPVLSALVLFLSKPSALELFLPVLKFTTVFAPPQFTPILGVLEPLFLFGPIPLLEFFSALLQPIDFRRHCLVEEKAKTTTFSIPKEMPLVLIVKRGMKGKP